MKNQAHWPQVSLEDIAEIQTGLSKSSNRKGEFVRMPFLRVANVQDGFFDLEDIREIDVPKKAVERFRVRKGDVLLTEGGDFDKLGRGAIWKGEIDPCVHQNHLFVVRPDTRVLDTQFFAYQTSSPAGRAYFQSCSKQSTNLASINSTQLKQFPTLLPKLPEQRKIAALLGTWDRGIETITRLIRARTRHQRGLRQRLLSGDTRFPEFRDQPWVECRLGDLLKQVWRPIEWAPDKEFRLVSIRRRSGGLFDRGEFRGDEFKTKDLHRIESNDFLISKRQVSHGALAMVKPEFAGACVSKEYTIFVAKDPAKLHMPFFDWLSRTPRMWHMTYVVSNGVVKEKLIFVPKDFLKFSIRIPPTLEEQRRIATLLDAGEREIALLRRQLEAFREQKRGLMQKLLTGEWRLTVDPEETDAPTESEAEISTSA